VLGSVTPGSDTDAHGVPLPGSDGGGSAVAAPSAVATAKASAIFGMRHATTESHACGRPPV
jgi:hypothetical protein